MSGRNARILRNPFLHRRKPYKERQDHFPAFVSSLRASIASFRTRIYTSRPIQTLQSLSPHLETIRQTLHAPYHFILVPSLVIWLASEFVFTNMVEYLRITGASMHPTLPGKLPTPTQPLPPTWVWSWKQIQRRNVASGPEAQPAARDRNVVRLRRGMLVTFWSPLSGDKAVKRVVGLEGDVVTPLEPYDGDETFSSARAVRDELRAERLRDLGRSPPPLTTPRTGLPRQGRDGTLEPITVPFGHVWLEGDNAAYTVDSNTYGPVSKSLVEGVVLWTWPRWFGVERVDFEGDGWEARMGGRLRRRADDAERVPVEWATAPLNEAPRR